MSVKKIVPTNDSEAIKMLDSVMTYLKNNNKNGKKENSNIKKIRKPIAKKLEKNGKGIRPENVIDLFASKGKEVLLEHLNTLEIPELKKVISAYGFDKSRTSKDWKDKDKFVYLILERVDSIINKGNAFKD